MPQKQKFVTVTLSGAIYAPFLSSSLCLACLLVSSFWSKHHGALFHCLFARFSFFLFLFFGESPYLNLWLEVLPSLTSFFVVLSSFLAHCCLVEMRRGGRKLLLCCLVSCFPLLLYFLLMLLLARPKLLEQTAPLLPFGFFCILLLPFGRIFFCFLFACCWLVWLEEREASF